MNDAYLVADIGFGDSGKGTITDSLVRRHDAKLVVRYNGGAQSAHHVVLPDGRWHSFHQFGSGTFAGARTHLSQYMLVDPFLLRKEADDLRALGIDHPWGRLSIDGRALVVTPYDMCLNRLREWARGKDRHGSCGMGIGEAVAYQLNYPLDVLRVGMLKDTKRVRTLLEESRRRKCAEMLEMPGVVADRDMAPYVNILRDPISAPNYAAKYATVAQSITLYHDSAILEVTDGPVVFEGAQGVLLDQDLGCMPHVTWSKTTFANAIEMIVTAMVAAGGMSGTTIHKIGVVRSYMTRHGAGPFPTEVPLSEYEKAVDFAEAHNQTGDWQGAMRVGTFDVPLVQYAIECCGGIDTLAVTHLDKVRGEWPVGRLATPDDDLWRSPRETWHVSGVAGFTGALQEWIGVPMIESHGPTHEDKVYAPSGATVTA